MEPIEHLSQYHLREAELVRWAEQLRQARDRLAEQAHPTSSAVPRVPRGERSVWGRWHLPGRPSRRRPA